MFILFILFNIRFSSKHSKYKVLKDILCNNIVVVYNHTLPILAQVVEQLTVEVYVIDVDVINRSPVRVQQIGKYYKIIIYKL